MFFGNFLIIDTKTGLFLRIVNLTVTSTMVGKCDSLFFEGISCNASSVAYQHRVDTKIVL